MFLLRIASRVLNPWISQRISAGGDARATQPGITRGEIFPTAKQLKGPRHVSVVETALADFPGLVGKSVTTNYCLLHFIGLSAV